jgi:hypothetical protein
LVGGSRDRPGATHAIEVAGQDECAVGGQVRNVVLPRTWGHDHRSSTSSRRELESESPTSYSGRLPQDSDDRDVEALGHCLGAAVVRVDG